ncbi:MAG: hypothetical protein RMJ81_02055 [Candidatus Kryptonium sp.]|nr:hypothetical protein [Candidatus Kryptonium sp.]MCX7763079.1 hypothetical protein [Candidatus Kryptonium sp.]MDW8108420.1 hypothetical protein [Candidatus Kryptonium sp.]
MKIKFYQSLALLLTISYFLNSQDLNLKNKNYICLSAGLGVNYINLPDVSDYITSITGKKMSEFSGAPELWLTSEFKISKDISIKIDYAYTLKQYNLEETSTGVPLNYTLTYKIHTPSLILNYLSFQPQEIYIIKIGAGFGFVNGYFSQILPLSGKEINYRANGGMFKIETAFSSRLDGKVYVHLSADAKFGLTEEARDENKNKIIIRKPFGEDRNLRLNFFGVAIRFGFSYYF